MGLNALSETITSETGENIPNKDWILGLMAVEDSLETRRGHYGYARGYLDFLQRFMEEGSTT